MDTPSIVPPDAAAPPLVARATFTGEGAEYFKIWIVNVALSIVTLGIYSAWAKVRRLQYFYRNTRLADASFDYHGDPVAILKGRLIAVALFGIYSFSSIVNPLLTVAVLVAIGAVMPWLLCRSLRFRMHNSSYRGLRFRFDGSSRSAYWVFLGLLILTFASFGLLLPFWQHRMRRYQYGQTSYGRVPFAFNAPVGEFYVTYLAAAAIGVCLIVAVGIVFAGAAVATIAITGGQPMDGNDIPPQVMVILIPFFALIGLIYLVGITTVQAFVAARLRNVVWNNMTLGNELYRFSSDMRVWPYLRLTLANLVATVATLGLFWPFAQVRTARYLTATLQIEGPASFGAFGASAGAEERAVGEEVAEFFDFDVGL